MFYRSGNMNQDVQSEILSRNLSSFLKLRTHSQHLKMDVHIEKKQANKNIMSLSNENEMKLV